MNSTTSIPPSQSYALISEILNSFSVCSLEDLPDLLKVLVAVQLVLRADLLHGTTKDLWGLKKMS